MKRELCNQPDPQVCALFAALLVTCGVPNTYGYVQMAREHLHWAIKARGWHVVSDERGIPRLEIWQDTADPIG